MKAFFVFFFAYIWNFKAVMKNSFYIFLFITILFSSCEEKKAVQDDPTKATDTLEIAFTHTVNKVQLLPEGEKITTEWPGFVETAQEIETLGKVKIAYIKQEGIQWIKEIKKMRINLPDSLDNVAIKSRLVVLETKAGSLVQEAKKDEVDTAMVFNEATELSEAFQHLKTRINIQFQKSVEELLEEYREDANDTTSVIPQFSRPQTPLKRQEIPNSQNIPQSARPQQLQKVDSIKKS